MLTIKGYQICRLMLSHYSPIGLMPIIVNIVTNARTTLACLPHERKTQTMKEAFLAFVLFSHK